MSTRSTSAASVGTSWCSAAATGSIAATISGDGPGFFFDPQHRVSNRSNVFAQAQFDTGRRVFVTAGAKVEHNEFTGVELQPSLSVRWTGSRSTVWGSVSKAVRVPTRFDTDCASASRTPASSR